MKRLLFLCAAACLLSTTAIAQLKSTLLTGTWRVTTVKTTGPNATTRNSPQPGLYIFTGTHYSITTVNSDQARPAVPDQGKATDAQLRAAWDPFTANAGTYEISGGTVSTKPIVAKNPAAMAAGANNVFSFTLTGKTLTLTQVSNANGKIANPATTTLTRVE